jgi:Protein of unknown function (DUF1416)
VTRLSGTIDDGAGAFVQLRNADGDFVGEVRADARGRFVFHAIPGHWLLVCLTPGPRRRQKEIDLGVDDIDVRVPA